MTSLKSLAILLLLFIIISSSVFIDHVLGRLSEATHERVPTTYGVFLQGLFLVILYAVADGLNRAGYQ